MWANIMNRVFKSINTPHYKLFHITSLRHTLHFSADPIRNICNETESASYLGLKIWEQIPAGFP